jgi:hypothetical protein
MWKLCRAGGAPTGQNITSIAVDGERTYSFWNYSLASRFISNGTWLGITACPFNIRFWERKSLFVTGVLMICVLMRICLTVQLCLLCYNSVLVRNRPLRFFSSDLLERAKT